jgi:hypothetical protein
MAGFVIVSVVFGAYTVSGQWRSLAVRFPAPDTPPHGERRFGFSSLRMMSGIGGIYQGCVTIGVSERGLSLTIWAPIRLFHPPLLIPWRAVRSCEPKTLGLHEGRQVDLGDGDGFWIPGKASLAIASTWGQLESGRMVDGRTGGRSDTRL